MCHRFLFSLISQKSLWYNVNEYGKGNIMNPLVTEQISDRDWNATPPAVQQLLLALEREMNSVREQLRRLEHAQEAAGEYHRHRLQRYHTLVEQQFLSGLTPEEQEEIERLGREIDAVNFAFYPSLSSLAETIEAHTGNPPK